MCNQLTYLAAEGSYRYVACCEHGTIHLSWERVTLHWHPKDFVQIARFLETAVPHVQQSGSYGDPDHFIHQEPNGYLQVWLAGTGFYLSPGDFESLVQITRVAARNLQSLGQRILQGRKFHIPRQKSPHRFSPN